MGASAVSEVVGFAGAATASGGATVAGSSMAGEAGSQVPL